MKAALALLQKHKHLSETMPKSESGTDPLQSEYHAAAFLELREQLKPYAQNGDIRCQYVLACLYGTYPCYTTKGQWRQHYEQDIQEATRWWVAAVKQGHPWALDNLVSCGVGPEAEKARQALSRFREEKAELIASYELRPDHGFFEFIWEFCRFYIGFVATNEQMNY